MFVEKINIKNFITDSKDKIAQGSDLTEPLETALFLLKSVCDRLVKNNTNSSNPPSSDSNGEKEKEKRKTPGKKKPGGQPGHPGSTLERKENPDKIVDLEIDRGTLPPGEYKGVGYDSAQVFDIEVSTVVTEYRAEILEDKFGNRYVAEFPDGVTKTAQYGIRAKSLSV